MDTVVVLYRSSFRVFPILEACYTHIVLDFQRWSLLSCDGSFERWGCLDSLDAHLRGLKVSLKISQVILLRGGLTLIVVRVKRAIWVGDEKCLVIEGSISVIGFRKYGARSEKESGIELYRLLSVA